MAYCKQCGKEVTENSDFCPHCGATVNNQSYNNNSSVNVNDTGGFGWGLLGFCIPIVGLILFLVWKQERPLTAKAAGIGAAIGFVLNVISAIIYASALSQLM